MPRVTSAALPAAALIAATFFGACVHAKLPPLSDEAKAKAADTAAKTAWSDKVGAYQLCRAMDRTAEYYRKSATAAAAALPTPPCTDPGPYAAPASAPPLEASGAHSPPGMAVSPPGSKATSAELDGKTKK